MGAAGRQGTRAGGGFQSPPHQTDRARPAGCGVAGSRCGLMVQSMRALPVLAVLMLTVLSACAARTATDTAPTQPEGAKVNPALENKYWKLIQLGENTQLVGKDKQEPHI